MDWSLGSERDQSGQYRLTKKGEANDRVDVKNRKEPLLPFVFCFRTVTCDCKDPGARAGSILS